MEALIAIPSKGRSSTLARSTLRFIPPDYQKQTKFFVPEDEFKKYKNAMWNCMFTDVEVIPGSAENIAIQRRDIGLWAAENGFKKFIMLDDDLTAWAVRPRPSEVELKAIGPGDLNFTKMFETVDKFLGWYAHVGVSPRQMNNGLSADHDDYDPFYFENKRLIRFLAYQTDKFNSCEHGRVIIAEDFDVTLQLLTRGYKNCQFYQWTQDQSATNIVGGCSTYRTLQLHHDNMIKLHQMWPQFVKLTTKKNISAEAVRLGLAERTEVIIQWEQAYEYGAANNPQAA